MEDNLKVDQRKFRRAAEKVDFQLSQQKLVVTVMRLLDW